MEVDGSDTGVGAVLLVSDNKMHPCTYFSCKLTPAERNYNTENRELLAVKLALEEWWQSVKGADQLFQVCTYHKNSLQAR